MTTEAQERAQWQEAVGDHLRAAQDHLDRAAAVFRLFLVEQDIPLQAMTPEQVATYVSAAAGVATAHAAMATARAQVAVRGQLEDLTELTAAAAALRSQ